MSATWDEPAIRHLAANIADRVAKNTGAAPELCFPHIYLGLKDALGCELAKPADKPVAWTLTATLDKRETTTRGYLWFTDPVNACWSPLYAAPQPDEIARLQAENASLTERHRKAIDLGLKAAGENERLREANAELATWLSWALNTLPDSEQKTTWQFEQARAALAKHQQGEKT